jgi:hypothetical protein
MPRPEAKIDTIGPVAAFAQQLRNVRNRSGLTYEKLAVEAQYHPGTLAYAARGKEVPTWDLARAYLRACGVVDPVEIKQWERDWHETRRVNGIIPPSRRLAAEEMPDPRRVRTYRDLLGQLRILKIAAGDMPYRCFYFGTPNFTSREATRLPRSTVSDLFSGKHVGRFEVFALVARGLLKQAICWYGEPQPEDDMAWHNEAEWHLAWRRAKQHLEQQREDANRNQNTAGNPGQASGDNSGQDNSGLAAWMANDLPDLVAIALRNMDPHRRNQVLHNLPFDVSDKLEQMLPAENPDSGSEPRAR